MLFLFPFFLWIGYVCNVFSRGEYRPSYEEKTPKLVSWRVLEGVTEPFDSYKPDNTPAWKQMKLSADAKSANQLIQQALHEYGQLIRHPHMFGEMPMEDRYDVFLSMSKLLKQMGFHQRAELLLYEAMSYSSVPHEAHLQLALLLLDRENLDMAKVHLKNCLFFRESDVLVLVHLTVVLIAEGRHHEAKFFITRILSNLHAKYERMSQLINIDNSHSKTGDSGINADKEQNDRESPSSVGDQNSNIGSSVGGIPRLAGVPTQPIDLVEFYRWLENIMSHVFYGDLRISASSTTELYKMFSDLHEWISLGEMTGRFVFDLGQALYEGGRPNIGHAMMRRGLETSNATSEGDVSPEIVKIRLALDYPVIATSLFDIIDSFLNTTNFLSTSSNSYVMIDMENVFDIYWPIPLLGWSGLPVWPLISELMWRFSEGRQRKDAFAQVWLTHPNEPTIPWINVTMSYDASLEFNSTLQTPVSKVSDAATSSSGKDSETDVQSAGKAFNIPAENGLGTEASSGFHINTGISVIDGAVASIVNWYNGNADISIGKPMFDLSRTAQSDVISRASESASKSSLVKEPSSHHQELHQKASRAVPPRPRPLRREIVVEVGILGGHMNSHPVGQMMLHRIVDLVRMMSTNNVTAGSPLFQFTLIALPLVPDSVTSKLAAGMRRIVNLPMDTKSAWTILEQLQLDIVLFPDWQPFPDVQSALFQWKRLAPVQICVFVRGTSCASAFIDYYLVPSEIEEAYLRAIPAADSASTIIVKSKTGRSTISQAVRPAWREWMAEQTVFLDWPLVTTRVINTAAAHVIDAGSSGSRVASRSIAGAHKTNNHYGDVVMSGRLDNAVMNAFSEQEGQIFFEGQPVAVVAAHPTHIHPLMDDTIFKIMHTIPTLQVVLVLPESFFSHATDMRQRTCWSRKLVRRLWDRGGDLFHRIRLLPATMDDAKLLQLLRQADMVLDSFPIGGSFQTIALALSVGTPVVTLRSGVVLTTPPKDLREVKHIVQQHAPRHRSNPLYRQLLRGDDLPWSPSISSIAGWYDTVGLSAQLTADNITAYATLASRIASNREMAYGLRVHILDIVDGDSTVAGVEMSSVQHDCSFGDNNPCLDDLARFLYSVGRPWAHLRLKHVAPQHPIENKGRHIDQIQRTAKFSRPPTSDGQEKASFLADEGSKSTSSGSSRRRKRRAADSEEDIESPEWPTGGSVIAEP